MKPKLTNNYLDFIKKVEIGLLKPFSTDTVIVFGRFPALGSGHLSVQLIKGEKSFLLTRRWDQDLGDSQRLGIYHLDNIVFEERVVSISETELKSILSLDKEDVEIANLTDIILDGVDYKLQFLDRSVIKDFDWRLVKQLGTRTKEWLDRFVQTAGLQQSA